ncbi:hypothetical protein BKA67DRAFT_660828 [Truncatella angustata]|uniref:DUF7719 domain-containing protein n=1 Tax=Truncatella angustata TaxID=152316 RepID=A0A9P8UH06_9PEZI|nr:uncharacterized protein BKA67DRAFT_660828 [Truncatella angustata]KAH6652059.1 hypothetical protein BKA67DRAFT_660828 [Truncatella angustata]
MVQTRKERKSAQIPLSQPDRSVPTEKTLLELAQERQLFDQADVRQRKLDKKPATQKPHGGPEDQEDMSPTAERILDVFFWSVSLSMLHFTLDVLVQHQYAVELSWSSAVSRTLTALFVFSFLMFFLHAHPSSPTLVSALPDKYQTPLRQGIFFVTSVVSGCYLIYISNTFSYIAVMKQAPSIGCLWIWSVIELNVLPAVISLACAGGYLWFGGYKII